MTSHAAICMFQDRGRAGTETINPGLFPVPWPRRSAAGDDIEAGPAIAALIRGNGPKAPASLLRGGEASNIPFFRHEENNKTQHGLNV